MWLHQKQHIKIIKKFGQAEAKTVATPADVNVKLTKEDGISKSIDLIQCQSIIGSLLYLAVATRPDIKDLKIYDGASRRRGFITKNIFIDDNSHE